MSSEHEQPCQRDREITREHKESKEKELDPEAARAAMKERADYLVKEVKTNKQQMQNIMVHMQQVMAAIRTIRQQLQLATDDDAVSSVVHDSARIEKMKKQMMEYKDELLKMKDDLIAMQSRELEDAAPQLTKEQRDIEARNIIDRIYIEIFE